MGIQRLHLMGRKSKKNSRPLHSGMRSPTENLAKFEAPKPLQLTAVRKPRVLLVGPLVGRNKGRVTTQGEIGYDYLRSVGWSIEAVSVRPTRLGRILDITRALFRTRRWVDIQWLKVYGGLSFVVEDLASAFGKTIGCQIVLHIHGGAFLEFMEKFPNWTRRVLQRADVLITPSQFLAAGLRQRGFAVRIIPNIVPQGEIRYKNRTKARPRLIWMRAFHPIYAPEVALRAFAKVIDKYPNATLTMAGEDKGFEKNARKLAIALGIEKAVNFVGFLEERAKAEKLNQADIFINTTLYESFGVSVMEAAAAGLCIVTTNVGELPYIWTDKQTAMLVPPNDEDALAEAVCQILKDETLAARLSANAVAVTRLYLPENAGPILENVLMTVASVKTRVT